MIRLSLIIIFLVLPLTAHSSESHIRGVVVGVHDGDTITVLSTDMAV